MSKPSHLLCFFFFLRVRKRIKNYSFALGSCKNLVLPSGRECLPCSLMGSGSCSGTDRESICGPGPQTLAGSVQSYNSGYLHCANSLMSVTAAKPYSYLWASLFPGHDQLTRAPIIDTVGFWCLFNWLIVCVFCF